MHRMRRFFVIAGLALMLSAVVGPEASAGLIRPGADQAYPDLLAGAIAQGSQSYTYDASAHQGTFQVTTTPLMIWGGDGSSNAYDITPTSTGTRLESLSIKLDSSGNIVQGDPNNNFQIFGTVTANGQTYSGLLLSATPTEFGSQDLHSVGLNGAAYDLNMKVTGGALQQFYGSTAYLLVSAETGSTFNGSFTQNFSATKVVTNTRSYTSTQPFPIPEPSTVVLLVALGAGIIYRHRRRITLADLEA